jgi:hypothetical protein
VGPRASLDAVTKRKKSHNCPFRELNPGLPARSVVTIVSELPRLLHITCSYHLTYSRRDSSVAIALGYGLDDRGSRVRFPAGAGNFSLHHRVQTGSGTHPASYPVGTRDSFPGGKAAPTSI